MKTDPRDHGQILILTAAALFVLLAIGALVVDLGFSWMLRRQEQNAADPAALAAARFISEPDPATGAQSYDAVNGWNAACRYAVMNGFFDTGNADCSPEPDGTSMTVNWPPRGDVSDYFVGDRGFVQVIISDKHPSFFSRILGEDGATVSTSAVAARQRGNTNTYSLVALNPTGCSTARVRGDSVIDIHPAPSYSGPGGYVQVNADCPGATGDDNCSTAGSGALDVNGGATLIAPMTNVHGSCKGHAAQPIGELDEAAHQIGDPLAGLQFPAWDTSLPGAMCGQSGSRLTAAGSQGCGQGGGRLPWKKSPNSACPGLPAGHDCIELDPGIYYGGWDIGSKVRVNLKPGIYILAGGGISIGSTGSLDSMAEGTDPAPVLIFSTDNPLFAESCPGAGSSKCQGSVDITAQASLKLAGLIGDQPCPPVTTTGGCPLGGMVIWHDGNASQGDSYSGQVDIEGGSVLLLSGTIYAPRAHVDITGNVSTNCPSSVQTASVQIIAWTWDIGGTGDLCMPYDPSKLYKMTMQGLVD